MANIHCTTWIYHLVFSSHLRMDVLFLSWAIVNDAAASAHLQVLVQTLYVFGVTILTL